VDVCSSLDFSLNSTDKREIELETDNKQKEKKEEREKREQQNTTRFF
jgi:hypothetical protein